MFVGYVGVAMILSRGEFAGFAHFDAFGVALALFSTLLWAGYWIATVRLRVHPVPMMLNGFAVATPLVALVCHFGPGIGAVTRELRTKYAATVRGEEPDFEHWLHYV